MKPNWRQVADAPRVQNAVEVVDLVLHDAGVKIADGAVDGVASAASTPV